MPKTSDRIKLKTFKKVVIMTDVIDTMVYAIMQETGTPNYSQAVRDAIFQRHRSVKPPYLEPSVDQQKKRQKLEEDQKIADMTDEEYVTDVIHGNLLTDDSGAKFCVVHFYANTIKAIPIAEVRKYFSDWPADLDFHLAKLSEIPIESLIEQETHRAYLKKNFNVDIVV